MSKCDSDSRLSSVIAKLQSSWTFGWSSSISAATCSPWLLLMGIFMRAVLNSRTSEQRPMKNILTILLIVIAFTACCQLSFLSPLQNNVLQNYCAEDHASIFMGSHSDIWIKYDKVDLNTWSFTCKISIMQMSIQICQKKIKKIDDASETEF